MALHVVLVEPEIPQNTGNIVRTCAATGCVLHLVEPLGFSIDDKQLKRAGLDYWHLLDIRYHASLEKFLAVCGNERLILLTTKAQQTYSDFQYRDGDYLVFGKETRGLPEAFIHAMYQTSVRIPMRKDARSLNLSNAVAIEVYEALRQLSFPGLSSAGCLRGY
ncbi:MAG: tRNA (uridine(34)/cytosine(34)/5-carboxymethylaminomethyluridine(34)-2'-O)-methyltransferase TrmL [Christensenellales bacterium]|jgi:tRNA (cytidine/uridine-2'-O-)-methyltransferase